MISYGGSDGLQERAKQAKAYGYNIVSDVVQEGAVWRLHPVYDTIRSDGLRTAAHCRTAG
jgi:hypothetical protein